MAEVRINMAEVRMCSAQVEIEHDDMTALRMV
jgi:hypothetical protein